MKNKFLQNILKKLCFQPGISGYEKECGISDLIFNLVKNINFKTWIDSFGNIISVIGNGKKVVILEAHMDEVGFIVKKTNKSINICPQGIIKGEKVENSNALIVGKNIKGNIVINEKKFVFKPTKIKTEKVKQNDIIAFNRCFIKKNNGIIEASALDNRIGCSVLISIIKNIIDNISENITLVFVFSTKEEIDESCFKDVIKKYGKGFVIVCDAAYAWPVDFDTTKEPNVSIPILGNGCAIQLKGRGFKVKKKIIERIEGIARNNNIKFQEESAPRSLGKTNLAKMLKQGVKKGAVINVPVKNQHHQFATANILDAEKAVLLILSVLKQFKYLDM